MPPYFKFLSYILFFVSINSHAAIEHDELVELRFSQSSAVIQSEDNLAEHLNTLKALGSPLLHLSETGRKEFIDSIVWTDGGIGSFSALPLELELNVTQAYQILQLFGLESVITSLKNLTIDSTLEFDVLDIYPENRCNIRGYHCVPPATCQKSLSDICITCNCGMAEP